MPQTGPRGRYGSNRAAPAGTRWCPRCHVFVALTRFGKRQRGYCKPCDAAKQAQRTRGGYIYGPRIPVSSGTRRCTRCRTVKSLNEFAPYQNAQGQPVYRSYCRPCFLEIEQLYRTIRRPAYRATDKRSRDRKRDIVFDHYGRSCVCCGTAEMVFLSIDHIEGGGTAHMKSLGGRSSAGSKLYKWLVKHNLPPGFQVLCRNCNWAKYALGSLDHCPHRAAAS